MRAHVGQTFALLGDVKEPGRPQIRHAVHFLEQMMQALDGHGGLVTRPGERLAEEKRVIHEGALQHHGDFEPLGHGVEEEHAFFRRGAQGEFERGKILRLDDPGFVCQDVQSVAGARKDAVDLAAIPTGHHHELSGALAEHALQKIGAGIHAHPPVGGILAAQIELRDAVEMGAEVSAERRVNKYFLGNTGQTFALEKRGVKVAGIKRDQF